MQLVTDRGADMSQQQLDGVKTKIHYLPLTIVLDGKEYESGVDVQPEDFYELLEASDDMPSTSLPSPDRIETQYREIAEATGDSEILAVLISNGLSGTFNAARLAAESVKADGINVHMIDTRTLSGAEGWQVEAAGRAIDAGYDLDQIKTLLGKISKNTNTVYTLPDLKYLIHGGRIGHMKGLIASTLGIKPIIGVSYEDGKYEQRGQVRTFNRAVKSLPDNIAKTIEPGTKLRVQLMHALSPESAEMLKQAFDAKYDVEYLPTIPIAPVLGAHTGIGLTGCAYAPIADFPALP